MKKALVIASWVCLSGSALIAVTALVGQWGVNAEAFGAHDFGLAVYLAFFRGVALVIAIWSAPVFLLAGLLILLIHKQSGLRLIAAGIISVVLLLGNMWR